MSVERDRCRRAAAECIELARVTSDPAKREVLLTRAQEWIKLAYAEGEADFERLVAEMNDSQMLPTQRQPVQQQQSKMELKDQP